MDGKVEIRLSYHGKPWVYHTVSDGFLGRLRDYLARKPYLDTVVEVSPYWKSVS